jgi:hypothetical protein
MSQIRIYLIRYEKFHINDCENCICRNTKSFAQNMRLKRLSKRNSQKLTIYRPGGL